LGRIKYDNPADTDPLQEEDKLKIRRILTPVKRGDVLIIRRILTPLLNNSGFGLISKTTFTN